MTGRYCVSQSVLSFQLVMVTAARRSRFMCLLRLLYFLHLTLDSALQNLWMRRTLHNLCVAHMEGAGRGVLDRRIRGECQHREYRHAQLEENRGQRQGLVPHSTPPVIAAKFKAVSNRAKRRALEEPRRVLHSRKRWTAE